MTNPVNGCVSSADVEVFAADLPPLLNGGSVEPLTCLNPGQPVEGASVQEYAPFGPEGLTPIVSWTNANNGTTMGVSPSTGSLGPIINAAGTYQLVVEWAETGCADSVSTVEQGEDFGVDISSITPNILTANNDGKNDSWYPYLADMPDVEALGVLTNYALRIYNRWGQVVFTNAAMGLPPAPHPVVRRWQRRQRPFPIRTTTWSTSPSTCGNSQDGSARGDLQLIRE